MSKTTVDELKVLTGVVSQHLPKIDPEPVAEPTEPTFAYQQRKRAWQQRSGRLVNEFDHKWGRFDFYQPQAPSYENSLSSALRTLSPVFTRAGWECLVLDIESVKGKPIIRCATMDSGDLAYSAPVWDMDDLTRARIGKGDVIRFKEILLGNVVGLEPLRFEVYYKDFEKVVR